MMGRLPSLLPEQNRLLFQTDPGTPGGTLLRRYWQPVSVVSELPLDGDPKPIKVMGEDLVLFRDGRQRIGLIGRYCPHRGVDLSYARVEERGLRCLYHGWLLGADGRCLDQPAQPPGTSYANEVKHAGYPCREAAGVIFAYMGGGEPPPFPRYDVLAAQPEHVAVSRNYYESNYIHDLDHNLDPSHVSFIHIQFIDSERSGTEGPRPKMGITNTELSANTHYAMDGAPTVHVETVPYGLRVTTIRRAQPGKAFIRGFEFIYPNIVTAPVIENGYTLQYHVPIDDHSHWRYDINLDRDHSYDHAAWARRWADTHHANGALKRNRSNRYRQDRTQMDRWYAGMGSFPPDHDGYLFEETWALEARADEQLGVQDIAIVATRELMLGAINAIQDGRAPPPADDGAAPIQQVIAFSIVVDEHTAWQSCWTDRVHSLKSAAQDSVSSRLES